MNGFTQRKGNEVSPRNFFDESGSSGLLSYAGGSAEFRLIESTQPQPQAVNPVSFSEKLTEIRRPNTWVLRAPRVQDSTERERMNRGRKTARLSFHALSPAPSNRAWSYPGRGCHGPGGDPFEKRERSSLRFDGAERRSTTLSRNHWSVGLWWGTGRRSRSMPPWTWFPQQATIVACRSKAVRMTWLYVPTGRYPQTR